MWVSALIEDRAWYEEFLAEAQKMNGEAEAWKMITWAS